MPETETPTSSKRLTNAFRYETYAWKDEPLSVALIDAITDATAVEPEELNPPIYEVVNPVLIEKLFADPDCEGSVVFTAYSYVVTVSRDEILVWFRSR